MTYCIQWDDLPQRVKENLEEYSEFHLVLFDLNAWLARIKSCFASFDASVNADVSTLVFPSEEVYTLFILRWA